MAVPEERHFFEKRRRPSHHPLQPPTAKVENVFAFHHVNFARFFLKILAPILRCFDFHSLGANVSRMCPRWRRHVGSVGFNIDKLMHHRGEALLARGFDLPWRAAKGPAIEKMRSGLVIPFLRW